MEWHETKTHDHVTKGFICVKQYNSNTYALFHIDPSTSALKGISIAKGSLEHCKSLAACYRALSHVLSAISSLSLAAECTHGTPFANKFTDIKTTLDDIRVELALKWKHPGQ